MVVIGLIRGDAIIYFINHLENRTDKYVYIIPSIVSWYCLSVRVV